eukprot:TRINITY_DN6413_c0_g1_i1.p1 TRINITY_DN6413_c0_g1~~TRINITY_DN6413_c0_g1_i1.p1  ORF type:complete len:229 (+),score=64.21 TRINITY_DN6413_c0_g1_i1:33-719(+)
MGKRREGGRGRGRGQKYQNRTAFRHNKNSKKTKKILESPNEGLCKRCVEIIEWRKKYRKYKPRTTPGKCVECHIKRVKRAYHVVCEVCAPKLKICAKCRESTEILTDFNQKEKEEKEQREFEQMIDGMSERNKKTFIRLYYQTSSEENSGEEENDSGDDQDGSNSKESYEDLSDESGDNETDENTPNDDDTDINNDMESYEEFSSSEETDFRNIPVDDLQEALDLLEV